jgi:hypothetical protein
MTERALAAPPHPTAEHLPHKDFERDGRLKIVIAGLDKNVRQQAVEAANEQLNAETNEKGFKGFVRGRIWKGNLAREYYLAKYQREAEGQIRESDNLLQHEGRSDEVARIATTLRYASEFEDEVIHEGETRTNIESDGSPEAQQIKDTVKDLIEQYASGALDDASFEEEKRRVMTNLAQGGVSQNYIGEGLLYADNLLQIAQNVRAAIDHGQSLDELMNNADIIVGEARLGARTEAKLSGTERIMKKLEGKAFVNEATVATAVSIAYSIGGWASKRAVSTVGKLAVPGIGAGVIAAARENRMLKEERALHMREMAEGKQFDAEAPGNKRRSKLEISRYETMSATDLKDQLAVLYDDEGNLRIDGDRARFDEAMNIIARIQARIDLSDMRKVDLISFSDIEQIEMERFMLRSALAKAKTDFRKMLQNGEDGELSTLGVNPGDLADASSRGQDVLGFVLDTRVDSFTGALSDEMTAKDRLFNKTRRVEVSKAFTKGTLLGVAVGLGVQEAGALVSHAAGVVEHAWGGDQNAARETLLNAPFSAEHGATEHGVVLTAEHQFELSDSSKITLPPGFESHIVDGHLNVTGPNNINFHDLPLNPDGSLTPNAVEALNSSGLHLSITNEILSNTVTTQEVVSGGDFVANHHDLATPVTRDFWYDNGTPTVFEGRELQLDFGGEANSGFDAEGNIVFDVSRMDLSPEELSHLQLALSATSGTQHEAFMVQFDAQGHAVIAKDSPLAALFSKGSDGNLVFEGKYAEAVEVAGSDANGVEHIRPLATVVGEGQPTFTDTVMRTEIQPAATYSISYESPSYTEPTNSVQVPPVVPVYGRRGLGATQQSRGRSIPAPTPSTPPSQRGAGLPLAIEPRRNVSEQRANAGDEAGMLALASTPYVPNNREGRRAPTEDRLQLEGVNANADSANVPAANDEASAIESGGAGASASSNGSNSEGAEVNTKGDFFGALDAEDLDTIPGYDFSGYSKTDQRNRKMAMRLIRRAIDELGGNDRAAVVNRAIDIANDELAGSSGDMADLLAGSLGVLRLSADRVARDNTESKGGEDYLSDLDSEAAPFPFAVLMGTTGYSPDVQKLVSRIYSDAGSKVVAELGQPPDSSSDPAGFRNYYKRIFREAQKIAHPDQYGSLSDDQRALFSEAQKAFNQARPYYV